MKELIDMHHKALYLVDFLKRHAEFKINTGRNLDVYWSFETVNNLTEILFELYNEGRESK